MNAVSSKASQNSAARRKEDAADVYTFRSMKELDELIEQANVRVAKAEYRLRGDYNGALLVIKHTFSWKRIVNSINIIKLIKSGVNYLFKRK